MTAILLSTLLSVPHVMPVDQVTKGQRGECLTVFEGDEVEPFPFVVKGVMNDFLGPGRDLVLIRLEGEKAEFTGVVAGMSGSPCSIEGKLVGALAYAFATFAKEPIAGITPFNGMADVLQLPSEERPWRIGDANDDEEWTAFRQGDFEDAKQPSGEARPIAAPLSMGGVPPLVREHFAPWLRSVGFEPVAAGAGGTKAEPRPLQPGSAVAAVLVRGDVDIAATGTVTSVNDGLVLAFGHPFFGAGAISLPMANATILNTMVSQLRSFKMSSTGATIGEVTQDRLTAISGVLGKQPAMVPVRGVVHTPNASSEFSFEVARDLALTPRFVAVATAGALLGRVDASERGIVRLKAKIRVGGMEPVEIEDVYAAQRDPSLFVHAAVDVAQAFSSLWDTPFGPPPRMSVEIDARFEPDPVEEWVETIHLDRTRVRPGDPLEVAVRLRRSHGGTSIERFLLRVPSEWAEQDVEIIATGVVGAEKLENKVGAAPRPTELSDIGRWLSRRRTDGRLYLMAMRQGAGMQAGVDSMAFLPPSRVAVMSGGTATRPRQRGIAWEEYKARPGVVSGRASAKIEVSAR